MTERDESGVQRKASRLKPDRRGPARIARRRGPDNDATADLKAGKARKRPQQEPGQTFTVSFTVTAEVDALIHRLAVEQAQPRSAVVRSAVLLYALRHGVALGED
jgi:hypothetical protein